MRISRKNNLNSLIVASSRCLTLFNSVTVSFRTTGGGATGRSSMFSEKIKIEIVSKKKEELSFFLMTVHFKNFEQFSMVQLFCNFLQFDLNFLILF